MTEKTRPAKKSRSKGKRKSNPRKTGTAAVVVRRRRRRNPSGYSKGALMDDAMAAGGGAAIGAISAGMDSALSPELIAKSPVRALIDLAAGVAGGVGLGMAGARAAGHGAIGAGVALATFRVVSDFGQSKTQADAIAAAVKVRRTEREAAKLASGTGGATPPQTGAQQSAAALAGMTTYSLRPRVIPAAPGLGVGSLTDNAAAALSDAAKVR
jgi:hypothetical protein